MDGYPTELTETKAGRVWLLPPPQFSYCPRHERWEVIVEDRSLCEWCCAPREWCVLHDDEWVEEEDEPSHRDNDTDRLPRTAGRRKSRADDGDNRVGVRSRPPQPSASSGLRQRGENEADRGRARGGGDGDGPDLNDVLDLT